MNPSVLEERPSYVSFESRAIEDREASIAQGHYVAKEEDYAIITPPGTRDRIERRVSDWMEQLEAQVRQERLPLAFYNSYKEAYKHWKAQGEVPVQGTYIKNVTIFSPSQIDTLLRANIKTVEDLAVCTEEAIARMGMGGRALKQTAINWLETSKDKGQIAGKITALELENKQLKDANEALGKQLKELSAEVQKLAPAKTGQTPL